MPRVKASGGRTFSKTCLVRGREGEGRKAILVSKRENTRIAPIGADGLTMDGSEKVPTSELVDVQPVIEASPETDAPIPGVMGDRGTVTIPSEIRRRLRLQAGSPVLIEIRGDEIRIQPAEIRPRGVGATESLDDLVARITPENRHEEISTGPARGREVW
jgi:antitoxin MazE